jgi:hypothetical protein
MREPWRHRRKRLEDVLDEPQFPRVAVVPVTAGRPPSVRDLGGDGWRRHRAERPSFALSAGRKTLTLDPGQTKNGEGRVAVLTPDLVLLLTEQVERVKALERKLKRIIPGLFPRLSGRRIGQARRDSGERGRRRAKNPETQACSDTTSGARQCGTWSRPRCRAPWL